LTFLKGVSMAFWKRMAQAVASPIKAAGWATKKIGQAQATRDLLGTSVSSAIARTGEGTQTLATDKPGLALAAAALGGGAGLTAVGALGAIEGYKASQASQMAATEINAMRDAKNEAEAEASALQVADTNKQLQARLKARQEEIMLRSGQTQKNIFGTGRNQPSGILG
jgi:hypothetical protein